MKYWVRTVAVLTVSIVFAVSPGFAESPGEAIYKEKCSTCHGVSGLADSGVGKIMKVKMVTDPEVRKQTEAEMIEQVRNGAGKMQMYRKSLTDQQIREVVDYFRTFVR